MNRRKFLANSAASALLLNSLPVFDLNALSNRSIKINPISPGAIDQLVRERFMNLLEWMNSNGWSNYVKNDLKIDIEISGKMDLDLLSKTAIPIEILNFPGIQDFGGTKLIEPGNPSQSLLYHILASPRVKSEKFRSYPELGDLDAAENYIYALSDYDYQKVNYSGNMFLAVLSYEYRPAFKAPPFYDVDENSKKYAQLVFSRTGIARIGNETFNYDAKNRSFTNQPIDPKNEKNIAITPARYALFVVELVEHNSSSIKIMNRQKTEKTNLGERYFINPITKVYDTKDIEIEFAEYHLNEKIKKLKEYSYERKDSPTMDSIYDTKKPPFVRVSSKNHHQKKFSHHTSDYDFIDINKTGSSLLMSSVPDDLIRKATQNGKYVYINVPASWGKPNGHTNTRYAALKLPNKDGHETTNVVISDVLGRRDRRTTAFKSPKTAPLFVNIKFEVKNDGINDTKIHHLDGTSVDGFEDKISNGKYKALIFEDSICDGCISAKIKSTSSKYQFPNSKYLPAFSLVTAPDFFPLVDSNDIRSYYLDSGINVDQDFFEGGTMNLSGIRQRGNPEILDPFTGQIAFCESYREDKSFDTLTAIVSESTSKYQMKAIRSEGIIPYKRDYQVTSYLPDTGTGVFYPGWDATYSGDKKNPYFASFGLGSPFIEDMKLCAAANGMWPVASPDAGRTFQGSLDLLLGKKPNTSIPLMDDEIGLNANSPYVKYFNEKESFGWDGEQGPFLEIKANTAYVNYTDIGRADYLHNLLNPDVGLDMSKLRKLESSELIARMDCLRKCVKHIDNKKLWNTNLWLVNAVKVSDWNEKQNIKSLPDEPPFNQINFNSKSKKALEGEGYFFVLAKVLKNKDDKDSIWDESDKRRKRKYLKCTKLWLCQVTPNALATFKIDMNKESSNGQWA